MNSLVQIAYNTISQFGLSDSDKQMLIGMLQGYPKETQKKTSEKKLKKVAEDDLLEIEVLKELLNNRQLFPPKNWNGLHKGMKVF